MDACRYILEGLEFLPTKSPFVAQAGPYCQRIAEPQQIEGLAGKRTQARSLISADLVISCNEKTVMRATGILNPLAAGVFQSAECTT